MELLGTVVFNGCAVVGAGVIIYLIVVGIAEVF